jgi:hypothetical protein
MLVAEEQSIESDTASSSERKTLVLLLIANNYGCSAKALGIRTYY